MPQEGWRGQLVATLLQLVSRQAAHHRLEVGEGCGPGVQAVGSMLQPLSVLKAEDAFMQASSLYKPAS